MTPLHRMFNPRSVAVIGASEDPRRIGGRPVALMKRFYDGAIYPVNPSRTTVQDLPAYPSLDALPGPVDLALIALPAESVLGAVQACAAQGIDACVVMSSGFAEEGPAGEALQAQLVAFAKNVGMRLMGPNCLGVANNRTGAWVTFAAGATEPPPAGPVSVIAQSGGFGSYVLPLMKRRGIGLNHWICLGNQSEVDFADCLEFLVEDPQTEVIVGYLEGIGSGRKLVAALRKARARRKFVIITKVGSSEAGRVATASHTATLAGEDAVYDAVLRQYGAYRAETVQEAFDVAYACTRAQALPQNPRTGLITISGGFGVLMADAAARVGLDVTPLPQATQARLKDILPYSNVRNPVDITAQLLNDFALYERTLDEVCDEGACAMAVIYQVGLDRTHLRERLLATLTDFRRRRPGIPLALVTSPDPEIRQGYEALGYLVFEEPSEPFKPLAALVGFARSFARGDPPSAAPTGSPPQLDPLPPGDRTLDEHASKALLARWGLTGPAEVVVHEPEDAVRAAMQLGFPVVLKIVSPDILHKSDVGGVALDLRDAASVRQAWVRMHADLQARAPRARLEGVLVAPMMRGGVECVLGVQNDPVFGPVVMVGLGGIFVEVLRDVVFRHAPVTPREAVDMLRELRGLALLEGCRGHAPGDIEALAQAIARVSELAVAGAHRIASIDVNPVLVMPRGQGVYALDGVVQLRA